MHSTLLQLEAVAQKQSEHRRQRPVTLAWEDPDVHKHEEDEDEDVPLAVLFPEKANVPDQARPLGLMEKRELEESEPLSRRRARLRGEPSPSASIEVAGGSGHPSHALLANIQLVRAAYWMMHVSPLCEPSRVLIAANRGPGSALPAHAAA